ncbi:M15 family metallopeptidase [Bacillus spongiae]|uniref:M15 family metallopeptidase n=1 Tax=Bacillus spongiae TaxID=2683610 RepID=A0ABU8HH84_9BACI
MKKWGLFLFLMVFASVNIEQFFQNKIHILDNIPNKIEDEETVERKMTKEEIYLGNLLLVNGDYPAKHESIKKDIIHLTRNEPMLEGIGLLSSGIYLSKEVALAFSELVAAAKEEGVNHFMINSGFRDVQEQNELYEEMGPEYALPAGYSEHNLGISLDVGSTLMRMNKAPEGKWIKKNAWKYGFILRYPEDKTEVTKIQYEPWHIRYVGLPHSAIMKQNNLALEEYIAYIKKEKTLSVMVNKERYTVSYYPISDSKSIKVPEDKQYDISGNNIDGVIITVHE